MMDLAIFERLGLALAVGLLIGLERGWHERAAQEGSRIAGIRTFGLIGLGGGLAVALLGPDQPLSFALIFAGFAALIVVAHLAGRKAESDRGITTMVAALLTFLLGALAGAGELEIAASSAVIMTLLLSSKAQLHHWLERIEYQELQAVLKLLLMSVVLLPVLPDRGYGPWAALNPYQIWWMVVLIAGISFCGYLGIRLLGSERGILVTGLLSGLASSTAATLSFARMSCQTPSAGRIFAAGTVAAAATMLPRILLILALINVGLAERLLLPLGVAAVIGYGSAAFLWRYGQATRQSPEIKLANPFEFWVALRFGLLLAAIAILSHGLAETLGARAVYGLAAVAGLGDVDAINLSMARLAGATLTPSIAATAITIAALTNTLAKAGLALAFGDRRMALPVLLCHGAMIAAGVATFLLMPGLPR